MKAIWLENHTLSVREDIPMPCDEHEALIKVRLAGICGTDMELAKGYYPFTGIIGHEFVGEVVSLPKTASAGYTAMDWIGKRVVGEINVGCGRCSLCRQGMHKHCLKRSALGIRERDGAFAEYVQLPVENLHRVPDTLSDEAAVFTEPLAAALEIRQQVHLRPTDRVLLIGAGRLGQLVAQALFHEGIDLKVTARYPEQQSLLKSYGISIIDSGAVSPQEWDVVIEATGSPAGFHFAANAVRPGGTLVIKSTYREEVSFDLSRLVVKEITIVGSRCGPFEPALRMLASGDVDPIPLIVAKFRLDDALEAFDTAAKPGAFKVLIQP